MDCQPTYDEMLKIEVELASQRKCRVCKRPLPLKANSNRIYCDIRCKTKFDTLVQRIRHLRARLDNQPRLHHLAKPDLPEITKEIERQLDAAA